MSEAVQASAMQRMKGGLMRRVAVACLAALVAGVTGATSQAGSRSSLASGAYPGSNGKIVFESMRDDREREIYVMNADGSGQLRLTQSVGFECCARWSPDGNRIAFASARSGGQPDIYVMRSNGRAVRRLTRNGADDVSPTWSPDGKRIAFESYRDGHAEVYTMNADGSDQKRVTHTPGAGSYDPDWSPDGKKIVFESGSAISDGRLTDEARQEIYVMDPDGSGKVRLTTNSALDGFPAWSPDGSKIAFDRHNGMSEDIYVMDSDGSDQTRLTRDPARDRAAAWSPDGTKITFTSNRGNRGQGTSDIWVMDADGTNPVRLTVSPDTDVDSDWQPLTDATTALAAKPSQSPLERQMERIAGRAVSIRKLNNGATLYILPGGREVEQAAGKTPYVVKSGQR